MLYCEGITRGELELEREILVRRRAFVLDEIRHLARKEGSCLCEQRVQRHLRHVLDHNQHRVVRMEIRLHQIDNALLNWQYETIRDRNRNFYRRFLSWIICQ